jgi:hypothetical protein
MVRFGRTKYATVEACEACTYHPEPVEKTEIMVAPEVEEI